MVSVAEKRNGDPKVAAYNRQVQAFLTSFHYHHASQPEQGGDEEVEVCRHMLYQVQAEFLEHRLNRRGDERRFSANSCPVRAANERQVDAGSGHSDANGIGDHYP